MSAPQAGALGYVLKDAADTELTEAVMLAAEGRTYLNPELGAKLAVEQVDDDARPDNLSPRELRGSSTKFHGGSGQSPPGDRVGVDANPAHVRPWPRVSSPSRSRRSISLGRKTISVLPTMITLHAPVAPPAPSSISKSARGAGSARSAWSPHGCGRRRTVSGGCAAPARCSAVPGCARVRADAL
jgi:hypothetical protein